MEVVMGPDSVREQQLCRMIDRYQTSLLRLCYMQLHDTALAEDAVQETFLKAYKAMAGFRADCAEKTWLMHIAVNTCRDMRRSAWMKHLDRRITPEQMPEPAVPPNEADVSLTLEVMQLPQRHREVILLYYYENMTVEEIAQALGVSKSTVSARLARGRENLRQVLEGGLSS